MICQLTIKEACNFFLKNKIENKKKIEEQSIIVLKKKQQVQSSYQWRAFFFMISHLKVYSPLYVFFLMDIRLKKKK